MDNGAPKRKRGRPKGSKSKHSTQQVSGVQSPSNKTDASHLNIEGYHEDDLDDEEDDNDAAYVPARKR